MDELAEILNCSRRHVYNLKDAKVIPYVKLGKLVRFDLAEVEKAIENKMTVRER